MAKAIRLYSGHDTYGCRIEMAERADGVWYWREYHWNGYGMGWSKWASYGKVPTFPSQVRNLCEIGNGPEFTDIPEEHRANRVDWGFNTLRIVPGPHRVRLPN